MRIVAVGCSYALLLTVLSVLQVQVAPPSLLQPRQWFASQGRVAQIGIGGVAAFAGITLLIAIVRTVWECLVSGCLGLKAAKTTKSTPILRHTATEVCPRRTVVMQVNKYRSPRAKRKRTVHANKTVVEGIDAYLPDNRLELTERAGRIRLDCTAPTQKPLPQLICSEASILTLLLCMSAYTPSLENACVRSHKPDSSAYEKFGSRVPSACSRFNASCLNLQRCCAACG